MLLEQLQEQNTGRTSCNFRVISSCQPEAEQAAALLARAMRRQGHRVSCEAGEVRMTTPAGNFHADVLLVLDETLLHRPTVRMGLPAGALLVVASGRRPEEIAWHLPEWDGFVATVDADSIGAEFGSDPAVVLLGAVARLCGCIDQDVLAAAVHNAYDSELPYLATASLRGCDAGYSRVHM